MTTSSPAASPGWPLVEQRCVHKRGVKGHDLNISLFITLKGVPSSFHSSSSSPSSFNSLHNCHHCHYHHHQHHKHKVVAQMLDLGPVGQETCHVSIDTPNYINQFSSMSITQGLIWQIMTKGESDGQMFDKMARFVTRCCCCFVSSFFCMTRTRTVSWKK